MNRSELIHRGWHERSIYATDASMYHEVPSGIAAPRDGEELQRIVAETAKHNEPILAREARDPRWRGKLYLRGRARFFSAHASTAQSRPQSPIGMGATGAGLG